MLSENLTILHWPVNFLQIESRYFQSIITPALIHQYKIYTLFFNKETYFFFSYPVENVSYICLGPIFNRKITTKDHPSDYAFLQHLTSAYTIQDFLDLPHASSDTFGQITFIYQMITGQPLRSEELKFSYQDTIPQPLRQEQTLDKELFDIRENANHIFSYAYEQKIIACIKNEDSTQARLLMAELMQIKDGRRLSDNQIQSMKYKIVSAVAIFTRAVIEVGVPVAKAYTLSDVYIIKIDQIYQENELYKIIPEIIIDFTALVKRYKHLQNPYWIKKCKDYISHNLHQRITLNELADHVTMNPRYLSTQFKKVTGQSLKQYINQKKIEEAQFLIKTSDYSLAEISEILQYANQSHFNKVFKEITGLTPIQYKNR